MKNYNPISTLVGSLILIFTISLTVRISGQVNKEVTLQSSAKSEESDAPSRPYLHSRSPQALAWAGSEVSRMSLDEKIGQLISIGVNATFLNQDSDAFRALRHQIEDNHIGGIILFRGSVYESVHLINRMQKLSREPLLVSADLEAGSGMRFDDTVNFPWNMAVGATGNPDYARRQGEVTAREARALGIGQILAPVADVNNNSANPVINVRSYGEDPSEVARFVSAFIDGAQHGGVISTAKHFPGHGDTSVDSHRGLPMINVGRARLDRIELSPFRAAIKAGVGAVMTGHIGLPQVDPTSITPLPRDPARKSTYADSEVITEKATIPASLSPALGDILRSDLGFDGLIVTDALDMSGLTIYFGPDEAAIRAVSAGADMLLKTDNADAAILGLRDAVHSGRISGKRIDESARRILAAKYDLGLARQRITPLDRIDRLVASREAIGLGEEIAEHAITLVRNDARLVPANHLKIEARILNLAITNGDDRAWIARPFEAAMARAGRPVETVVLDERSSPEEVREALKRASDADLVIASLYGRLRTGQSSSLGLPAAGARALATLLEHHKLVAGISFGNPYALENFPHLQTYLVAYGDMPSLQRAAARALLGVADLSGKLPISLPSLYARGSGIQLKAQPQTHAAQN